MYHVIMDQAEALKCYTIWMKDTHKINIMTKKRNIFDGTTKVYFYNQDNTTINIVYLCMQVLLFSFILNKRKFHKIFFFIRGISQSNIPIYLVFFNKD